MSPQRPVRRSPSENHGFQAGLHLGLAVLWLTVATIRWLDDDSTVWVDWAVTVLTPGYLVLAVISWRKARQARQAPPPAGLELRPVDETVLSRLVGAALSGAEPDEVTPPLATDGRWGPERIEWFRRFHRDRRLGLDGPHGEATWAITVDGEVVGAARLKRTAEPGVLEIGIWLVRDVRGQGAGRQAVAALIDKARDLGATAVRAHTSRENASAVFLLQQTGFRTSADADRVVAVRELVRR